LVCFFIFGSFIIVAYTSEVIEQVFSFIDSFFYLDFFGILTNTALTTIITSSKNGKTEKDKETSDLFGLKADFIE